MPVHQPSLWDNVALETGYRCLIALKLDEAIRQFNAAMGSATGDRESIHIGLATCQFWQNRIQQLEEPVTPLGNTVSRSRYMTVLLEDFSHYPFTPGIRKFKKALLNYLADRIIREVDTDVKNMETAFDLLLGIDDFRKAENLVSQYKRQFPENHGFLYLLAQVQWLGGNKTEARNNYARALLYHPDQFSARRIESGPLKKLIESYGPAMAPAYGWLRDILPSIPLAGIIKTPDMEHDHAIQSYRLMHQADESLKNNDMKSSIYFRKQLKELAPDLYEEYFNLLKQRRGTI